MEQRLYCETAELKGCHDTSSEDIHKNHIDITAMLMHV